MTSRRPVVLSPAPPAHLIQHLIQHCTHPSTLIVCSTRVDFLSVVAQHIIDEQQHHEEQGTPPPPNTTPAAAALLAAPLFQVAVARHIRVVFAPTVSHLRAHLSVFSLDDSSVPAPPTTSVHDSSTTAPPTPTLLIYGLLAQHRATSEWSVQGISGTATVVVEAAARAGMRAVVVEPRGFGDEVELGEVLGEEVPVLSGGGARRTGLAGRGGGGWAGRTVEVRRVLARWFDFWGGGVGMERERECESFKL